VSKIPRRAIKPDYELVPATWVVQEGCHFPKRFGPFTDKAEAEACVAVNPFNRTMYVDRWEAVDKPAKKEE
jgi:hypothetical protein